MSDQENGNVFRAIERLGTEIKGLLDEASGERQEMRHDIGRLEQLYSAFNTGQRRADMHIETLAENVRNIGREIRSATDIRGEIRELGERVEQVGERLAKALEKRAQ